MDENKLRELLQSNREQTRRSWRCPDDNDMSRYVGQRLEGEKRKKFEAHFADCDSCRQTIGFLVASEEWPQASTIPPHLVVHARDLSRTNSRVNWRWHWAMTTAAAACVLLFVAFIFFRSGPEQSGSPQTGDLVAQHQPGHQPVVQPTIVSSSPKPPPIQKPKVSEAPVPSVRGEVEESIPTLQFPRENAVVKREQLRFSWRQLSGAISYEIKVVTGAGALVYSGNTTQIQLGTETTQLPPGTYFVTVVAHMPDGRTARSGMVKFRLVE